FRLNSSQASQADTHAQETASFARKTASTGNRPPGWSQPKYRKELNRMSILGDMASAREHPDDVLDQEWLEFESLLNELSETAKSDVPFEPFAKSLLEKSVQILAAAGGAIWMS